MTEKKESKETKEKKTATKKKPLRETKQVKELKKQVEALQTESDQAKEELAGLKDQLLRKVAEFDNYKRRTEKEFIENIQSASKDLIEELLPVIDDLNRSVEHAVKEDEKGPLFDGIQLVLKNMMHILNKKGLSAITAVGEEFNPDEHNALLQVDSEEHESGVVVEEHQKGYKLNDKVIRHSQVLVAK